MNECIEGSDKRNSIFLDQYEATYERILTGAEEIIRRMKRTYLEKKEFCTRVAQDHNEYLEPYLGLEDNKSKY